MAILVLRKYIQFKDQLISEGDIVRFGYETQIIDPYYAIVKTISEEQEKDNEKYFKIFFVDNPLIVELHANDPRTKLIVLKREDIINELMRLSTRIYRLKKKRKRCS